MHACVQARSTDGGAHAHARREARHARGRHLEVAVLDDRADRGRCRPERVRESRADVELRAVALRAVQRSELAGELPGLRGLVREDDRVVGVEDHHLQQVGEHQTIVHMDHKRVVVDVFELLSNQTGDVLVRYDKYSKSADDEVRMASYQPRYSRQMKLTVEWIGRQTFKSRSMSKM